MAFWRKEAVFCNAVPAPLCFPSAACLPCPPGPHGGPTAALQAGDAGGAASTRPGQAKFVPRGLPDSLLQTVGLTAQGKARLSFVRGLSDLLTNRCSIPAI